jgi:uncharacterized membrane protein YvbJ
MENNIDQLFRCGEVQKDFDLNASLWNKIENKLDKRDNQNIKIKWLMSIAASIAFLLIVSFVLLVHSKNTYKVEDLDQLANPTYNAQVISDLHSYPVFIWDLNG